MATIIFDLDGTLIDTSGIVFPAFQQALERFYDGQMPTTETMKKTFGLPDDKIWELLMPSATEEQRNAAFAFTENRIRDTLFQQDALLPHAREVLRELKSRNHVLTVASNCGEAYLDGVLDSQDIRKLFTAPLCLGSVRGQKKADILRQHFTRFSKTDAVMVGDRSSDVEAANEHGIPTVGCTFGFGNASELEGAALVITSLPELLPLFPAGESPLLFPHRGR